MSVVTDDAILVLGGGLAGLAAAVRLAEAGRAVTLIETSRRLGGRASSHLDPETGRLTDNCQHVVLGCCTNLLALYERLGVADQITWHRDLHFFDKQGHHDVMSAAPWPAPLHLGGSLARFTTLDAQERRAIRRAMFSVLRLGVRGRQAWSDRTFAQWLSAQQQPAGAVSKYWEVVVVSALNTSCEQASAAYALQVFQEAFLAHRKSYEMGVSAVPLRELYDPAVDVIERAGGTVRFGASVESVEREGLRVTGVKLAGGEFVPASSVISALPFDRIRRVTDSAIDAVDDRLAGVDRLQHSPILGIHLWYEKPVMSHGHMIFVDSPLQWVFDKGSIREVESDLPAEAQHLHAVVSAANEWMAESSEAILAMAESELAAYLPEAKRVPVVRGRVFKEKRATFLSAPGIDRFRPKTVGAVDNLYLAGDWVATGWPATMEGAARSGYMAASAALGQSPEEGLVPDLPTAWLVRLLAQ